MLDEAKIKATQDAAEFLIAQGLLGIAVMALVVVVVYLWRENKAERARHDAEIVEERVRHNAEFLAERNRHATEIAAERKLNADLQQVRFLELKAALDQVRSVTATVDSALMVLGRLK